MAGVVGAVLLLWKFPGDSAAAYTGILCLAGFFIYGPQALVGIAHPSFRAELLAAARQVVDAVGVPVLTPGAASPARSSSTRATTATTWSTPSRRAWPKRCSDRPAP